MSMDAVGVVTLVLGLSILFVRLEIVFWILIVSVLFQASAAVVVGGNSITPPHLLLGFAALTFVLRKSFFNKAIHTVSFPRAGFWLSILAVWCVLSAFFMPRIFYGAFDVFPIGVSNLSDPSATISLGPTPGNITQSVYILGSLFMFIATSTYCSNPANSWVVARALVAFSFCNIAFAVIDLVGFWSGNTALLDPIHNGTYAMHTNEVTAGLHRISGSFSEAATFAYVTLTTLPFTFMLYLHGYMKKTTLSISIVQLCFLFASTSTTAYIASIIEICYLGMHCGRHLWLGRANARETIFLTVSPFLVGVLVIAVSLSPSLSATIRDVLDAVIFTKNTSDSGVQRGALNAVALQNFGLSFGLGSGNGSSRASSFVLAVLTNIGVFGAILYGTFLYKIFMTRRDEDPFETQVVGCCARAACFGSLVACTIAGTLVDLGLLFFICAGLASAGDTLPVSNRRGRAAIGERSMETKGLVRV